MSQGTEPPPRPVFEELDRQETRLGDLVLRRRVEPVLLVELYEVKLGDEFLMSSLFTVAERALASLGLAAAASSDRHLDVLVGGLGLGYTAATALADPRVRSLHVVDALEPVIGWHRHELLPDVAGLARDERCTLVHADFFAWAAGDDGQGVPFERYHAVLVDIDHTPRHHLHHTHGAFYDPDGLRRLVTRLHPGGVFGLWSDDPPDDTFLAAARSVFEECDPHVITFPNPHTGGESSNTVYVATTPVAPG